MEPKYQTKLNEAGELDLVAYEPTTACGGGTTFPNTIEPISITSEPHQDHTTRVQFYLKMERNVDLSADAIAKHGFTREVLYVTYDRLQRDENNNILEVIPFGIARQSTPQDIENHPLEYTEFLAKYNAEQESKRLARILINKRKTQEQVEADFQAAHKFPKMPALEIG
jgi:hypothetical protein